MFGGGDGRRRSCSIRVESGIGVNVSLGRTIYVDIHRVGPLVFLKGFETANIAECNRILLVNQNVGRSDGRMTEPVLMQSGDGIR